MYRADETKAMNGLKNEYEDRGDFVNNLGWLLSQTRLGIKSCWLYEDKVIITYNDKRKLEVNVKGDSYTAIMEDVLKHI